MENQDILRFMHEKQILSSHLLVDWEVSKRVATADRASLSAVTSGMECRAIGVAGAAAA